MKKMYDTNNHSVYLLKYHPILTIENRKKVINRSVKNRLKKIDIN